MESLPNPPGTAQKEGSPDSRAASGRKGIERAKKPKLHIRRSISASQLRSSKLSTAADNASFGKRRKMSDGISNPGVVTESNEIDKKGKIKTGIDSPGGSDGKNKRTSRRKKAHGSKQTKKLERTAVMANNSTAMSGTRNHDSQNAVDRDGRDQSQRRAAGIIQGTSSNVDANKNPGSLTSTEFAASSKRCASEGTIQDPECAPVQNKCTTASEEMPYVQKATGVPEPKSSKTRDAECIQENNAARYSAETAAPVTNSLPAEEDIKSHDVPEDARTPVTSKCLQGAEKDGKGKEVTTSQSKVSYKTSTPLEGCKGATGISGSSREPRKTAQKPASSKKGRVSRSSVLKDASQRRSSSRRSSSSSGKTRPTLPVRTGASDSSAREEVTDIQEASRSSSASLARKPGGGQATSTTSLGQTNRLQRTVAGMLFAAVALSLLLLNMARLFKRNPVQQPPVSPTKMGVFSSWGIVGHQECANTTRNILSRNGTVGDVAVAATLCMCVALPNRCGIGGGLFAIYYEAETGNAVVIDGRETAPSVADWKLFDKNSEPPEAVYVGVPGQMMALERLLNITGTSVPWADLFTDAINLAERGFPVGKELANIIASETEMRRGPLRDIFWQDGQPLKAGEVLVQGALARTLRDLAEKNASIYEGTLARALVEDLRAKGGYITSEDLSRYQVNVTEPIHFPLTGGYTLLAPRPPAGGTYLGLALSVLSQFVGDPDILLPDDSMTAHRLVEALKFAFGRRSVLGDPHYTDMDSVVAEASSSATATNIARVIASNLGPSSDASYYGSPFSGSLGTGTAHFGFLAPNGDAIVLASSLNSMFGSMVLSPKTGVLFNNVIRDFDLPHEYDQYNLSKGLRNQLLPGRRPLSSLSPALIVREGDGVAMALSASGGGRIISGIAQVVMRVLWMGQTVKQAIDWGRLHHQLVPDTMYAESVVSHEILDTLKFLGHVTEVQDSWPNDVMAIAHRSGRIYASYDYRRQTNTFVDGE